MSATQIPFERLKGRENYSIWKFGAKAHMITKGYWSFINTKVTDTTEQKILVQMKKP